MMKKANLMMNSLEPSKSRLFKRVECLCDCRGCVCEAVGLNCRLDTKLFRFEKLINFIFKN